ncbi:hypothetical protein GGS24DRAFT_453219 [Hypoxylon argillaceum]|nr:hypothetical protein GGS24DRAFT_453219 [Hypoxylon argillaceum]
MSHTSLKSIVSAALVASAEQSREFGSKSLQLATEKGRQATEWAAANPGKASALGAGAVLVAAPMLVAAPVLGAAGFGANGIIAGSAAAGAQSGIGSVLAPSIFATLQSAAAGGYGVAAVSATVQGLGGVVASSAGAASLLWKGKKEENEDADAKGDETRAPGNEAHDEENHKNADDTTGGIVAKL